ncbi:hypothetical protein D9M71_409810 [compost metagenome]
MRPGRAGHLRAPLQRGRFPFPPDLHRPGNPAHQPGGGDPADAPPAPGGYRSLPLHRAAGRQGDQGRLHPAAGTLGGEPRGPAHPHRPPAGAPAHRPAPGPHGAGRRPPGQPRRSAGDRRRAVGAGPARAADRAPAGRRPGSCAMEGCGLRFRRADQPLARLRGTAPGAGLQRLAQLVPEELPQLPAAARMARRPPPTGADLPRAEALSRTGRYPCCPQRWASLRSAPSCEKRPCQRSA